MYVEIMEYGGNYPASYGMRLSRKSTGSGDTLLGDAQLGPEDEKLGRHLMLQGDSHGKFARYMVTWLFIQGQRDWWQEMDTYHVGVEGWLSESTMYTIEREVKGKDFDHVKMLFPAWTSPNVIEAFMGVVANAESIAARAGTTPKLVIKAHLPEGFYQARVGMFSLQALQRIYRQRYDHEHHEWQEFIRQLLAKHPYPDLITMQ